jgi:hypothetical protein
MSMAKDNVVALKPATPEPVQKRRKIEDAQQRLIALICGSVNVIYVRCAEELRFERQVLALAKALPPPRQVLFFSTTQGITAPAPTDPTKLKNVELAPTGELVVDKNAATIMRGLAWAQSNSRAKNGTPTILIMRDVARAIAEDPNLLRSLRDTVRTIRSGGTRTTVLLLSPSAQPHDDVRPEVGYIDWPLPDGEDRDKVLDVSLTTASNVTPPQNGEREAIIAATAGLTAEQVANACAVSLVEFNRLDVAAILAWKAEEVRKLGLEYIEPDPTLGVGGLGNICKFLDKARKRFGGAARAYKGLRPPKGIFLAGMSGCLAGETPIPDPTTGREVTVRERWETAQPFMVWSRSLDGRKVATPALPPMRFPLSRLLRFRFDSGESITVTPRHRFFADGHEVYAEKVADLLLCTEGILLDSLSDLHAPQERPHRVKVVAVEDAGEAEYFDFHVPAYENYYAGGVLNHNCGKSLIARYAGTRWAMPLVRLDGSMLLGSRVGESEMKTAGILKALTSMAPCIVMIDEVEKVFAGAGAAGARSDGGTKRAVFGQMLTWLNDQQGCFVIVTANDTETLVREAPEFARKGRFDELFFVDLPTYHEREEIVAVHIKRVERNPSDFDCASIAAAAVDFSGAEIEAAIQAGLGEAFADGGREPRTEDFVAACSAITPLIKTASAAQNALREWAKGRCTPASSDTESANVAGVDEGEVGARTIETSGKPGGAVN